MRKAHELVIPNQKLLLMVFICCGSILSLVPLSLGMVMYYNEFKQRKIKFEPRIKLNHNMYLYCKNYTKTVTSMGNSNQDNRTCTYHTGKTVFCVS